MLAHPGNRPNHFTIDLAGPIRLEGDWEVAGVDIQFPHNWNTVNKTLTGILAVIPLDESIIQTEAHLLALQLAAATNKNGRAIEENERSLSNFLAPTANKIIQETRNKTVWLPLVQFFVYAPFKIPQGYYSSAQQLGDYTAKAITEVMNNLGITSKVQFKMDNILQKGTLFIDQPEKIATRLFLSNADEWNQILGFEPGTTFQKWELHQFPLIGVRPIQLLDQSSLYVYCDVVNHQLIGDTMAPLLGVVPIQKQAKGKQLYWVFDPPYYMDVSRNEISSIEVRLTTERGEEFPFLAGNVVCRLHFRPRSI